MARQKPDPNICNDCLWRFEPGADIIESAIGARVHRTCPRDYPLMGKTLHLPPCGCTVDGAGTLPNPVRIVFCAAHAAAKERIDALERALRQAHACATMRDDGTCDGCFVSDALGGPS